MNRWSGQRDRGGAYAALQGCAPSNRRGN